MPPDVHRIGVPVRYAAWLHGDLGRALEAELSRRLPDAKVCRLPNGLLVESPEALGPLVEQVRDAAQTLEAHVAATYPVLHLGMGPVLAGTLYVILEGAP